VKTGSIRLDFDAGKGSLPAKVFIYFESFSCDLFVRNPLRCTKCQNYGHTTSRCRSSQVICSNCGDNHNKENCTASSSHCHNCNGSHPAYSKDCPQLAKAKHVETVSAQYRITYSQALKQINHHHSGLQLSSDQENFPLIPALPQQTPISSINLSLRPTMSMPNPAIQTAIAETGLIPSTTPLLQQSSSNQPPPLIIPTLSDICPIDDLQQFILDVSNLLQRKLSDAKLKSALLQIIRNFFNPRPHRTSSSSKDSSHSLPKTKKHKR
jgi:hypothetical protein